jgi:hypothetical protein
MIFVDFSELDGIFSDNLKKQFDEQVALIPKARIIRSPFRIGLMKARMVGSANAKGPALIFMDAVGFYLFSIDGFQGNFSLFSTWKFALDGWSLFLID